MQLNDFTCVFFLEKEVKSLYSIKTSAADCSFAPLAVALCSCCELIDDGEMHRVARVAVDAVTPAHVRRQMAVADGAEIVTEEDACAHFRIGHTKFWQLVGTGVFPQPMKRGRNNVWLMAELLRRYAAHELKEAEPAA